jgi:hypothetical protein
MTAQGIALGQNSPAWSSPDLYRMQARPGLVHSTPDESMPEPTEDDILDTIRNIARGG